MLKVQKMSKYRKFGENTCGNEIEHSLLFSPIEYKYEIFKENHLTFSFTLS